MNIESANNFIDAKIYTVRGQSVMLDSDLAEVYGVETKHINQAVSRNERRFPTAYCFQLSQDEWDALRSQIVTLKVGRGHHRKYLPYVFTEHGAISMATVLNSDRAIDASLKVIDAFVRLRHLLASNAALASRIAEIEKQVKGHDRTITVIFHELKKLVGGEDVKPEAPKGRIGYRTAKDKGEKAAGKRGKKK